jgi:hypothetical protein
MRKKARFSIKKVAGEKLKFVKKTILHQFLDNI